jgi:hypothetical protein
MKLLRYVFYRLYQLMISVGNKDVAEYYSILLMAMLIGLNITALSALVYVFLGQKIDIFFGSKVVVLVEYLGLSFALYLFLVRKGKYLEVLKSYEGESSKEKIKGKLFAIVYFVLSIGMIIFCFYLMIKKNRGEL